jgi:3-methylfumaryl-CoA hydratase
VAADVREWIGRTETVEDVLTAAAAQALLATLDHGVNPAANDSAPQSIHWCLAVPRARMSELGADGHPRTGDFLPPSPLPRRMWAASVVEFLSPIRIGARIERHSEVVAVTEKTGASGRLMFVEVDHAIAADGAPAVRERQTIVYREAGARTGAGKADGTSTGWTWRRELMPDPVMLFRYSAATFNGHRIHYDLPYATVEEGYAGLVVQGPLVATLLVDLCARQLGPDALTRFAFRAVAPAFAGVPLMLKARREASSLALAAFAPQDRLIMQADADIRGGL